MGLDESYEIAISLIREIQSNLAQIETEQDARVQIINRLVTEVLGWPFRDIKTEPYSESGYADYLLSQNATPTLVVEAKRAGHVLIDSFNPKFGRYKVGGPALESALPGIRQAVGYCADHGVHYAALTNGMSWLAFQPFPASGQSYKDRYAFVFPSLSSILENFAEFFDLLSHDSVREKTHLLRFAKADGLAASEFEPMTAANRAEDLHLIPKSPLAADLEPVFREFFGSLSDDDREMLMECFVETRESQTADANLEKIVRSISIDIESLASSTGEQLAQEIEGAVSTGRGESVVIVGNKGAGKSTFIERFFEIVLEPRIREKCLVVRVDLLRHEGNPQTIVAWLNARMLEIVERALFADGHPTYDELQGLYWNEYQKWMKGHHKPLYETDKQAFKIKFGDFLRQKMEDDPHGYLIRLLKDAVDNRKLLPCLIFDNADHHQQEFQDAVFQFSQSIQGAVSFTFMVMPITDRSLWRLSKAGPFQTYATKMFYLPVPSPKEVLERRVKFIQRKIENSKNAREYFFGRGIRLNIENIRAFAASLEEMFIRQEFVGRRISWLANNDIRRSLNLTQQIIVSPYFSVDDLVKSHLSRVGETPVGISYLKFMQSLVLGNYSGFQQDDQSFVVNLFAVSPFLVSTPLLKLSTLKLLIDKAGEGGAAAYLSLEQLHKYFELMGASEPAVDAAARELLEFRLIEPYDASDDSINAAQRVAITHSGRMHYDMALHDRVYLAQMALATPLRGSEALARLREIKGAKIGANEWDEVRHVFMSYCLEEDRRLARVPTDQMYEGQNNLRTELDYAWRKVPDRATQNASLIQSTASEEKPQQTNWSYVSAEVKWFNVDKGYGFLDAGLHFDVFLHLTTLRKSGFENIDSGDIVVCDVGAGAEGKLQAIAVHSVEPKSAQAPLSGPELEGEVLFFNVGKDFGFVRAIALNADVYVAGKVLRDSCVPELVPGMHVLMSVTPGRDNKGYSASFLRVAK